MSSIYEDGSYLENNPTWHEEDSPWKAKQILNILRKNNIKPDTICEIGCGSGEILNSLSKDLGDKTSFTGYEISSQAFEICKRKAKPNLIFYLKDLLKENVDKFDLVMAIDVMEHVEDYFRFIRELRVKGTYKVFHIPLDMNVSMVLRMSPIMRLRKDVGHIHYFSTETALAILSDTGYEIIDYYYTGGFSLQKRGLRANWLKIPRRILFNINQELTVRIMGGYSLLVLAR
jgi:SAM-dependent methyltransferase